MALSSCANGRHHSCYIAGVSRGYQWFISVAGEVEGGYLGLAPLQLHHPLLGRQALVQLVHSHYMRAALPGLINMLGSSNVLGKQQQQCIWSVSGRLAPGHCFKAARKEKTTPFGVNLMRSHVLYRAAQAQGC